MLTLGEVALGKQLEMHRSCPHARSECAENKCDSVFASGLFHPDPSNSLDIDGLEVPAGEIQTRSDMTGRQLLHNEFIVYDVSQVKMRYLVTVRSEGNMSL